MGFWLARHSRNERAICDLDWNVVKKQMDVGRGLLHLRFGIYEVTVSEDPI